MAGMVDTTLYAAFLVAALALCVTPGPDLMFIVAMGGRGGPTAGVMAALGVACAMMVHAVAAALGLSALFTTLPTLYHVLRWAGAAYLLYLAVKAFRDRSVPGEDGAPPRGPGMRRAFWQGAITNLAELAEEVSAAFGRRVRPDLPADVVKAFGQAGVKVGSTRRWELESLDHPAVKPLIEYKRLYRIWVAHGWSWLQDWVRDGRFRPEFLAGGTVTGRWVTNGGGGLQIPKVIRRAVVADPGWRLVVADADQMEPRVLAAISRDPGLMEVAGRETDLYQSVSDRAFSGDRAQAKLAVLGAVYGQTSGDGLKNLAALRRRFPRAVAYVDDAARAGEEGRLVRTWLGRTCPPAAGAADGAEEAGLPQDNPTGAVDRPQEWVPGYASTDARARGRFARNFVVQGSAADWALLLLAALRQTCADMAAELVFFQHDEVIVHCPEEEAGTVVAAIREAAELAGRLTFGVTPVRFPFTTAVVECYADAK
ncbi:hypothetical protein STENM223S_09793 [Streptomyces tendae]